MRNRKAYPAGWRQIASQAKEAAAWRCQKCGVEHGTPRLSRWTGRLWPVWLQAAHVKHDPANPEPELVAVCPTCHWHFYRRHTQMPAWLIEKRKHRIVLKRQGYRAEEV